MPLNRCDNCGDICLGLFCSNKCAREYENPDLENPYINEVNNEISRP